MCVSACENVPSNIGIDAPSNSRSKNVPKLTIKPRVDHSGNCEKYQCCCRLKHLQTSHVLILLLEQKVHLSPFAISDLRFSELRGHLYIKLSKTKESLSISSLY